MLSLIDLIYFLFKLQWPLLVIQILLCSTEFKALVFFFFWLICGLILTGSQVRVLWEVTGYFQVQQLS